MKRNSNLTYFVVCICLILIVLDAGSRPLKKMAIPSNRITLNRL
jgi:hypothetical protein